MNELCRSINKKIFARKKSAFHFKYWKEVGKIYISSPIADEKVILNDNLKDVLGFKLNMVRVL
jgi:hypothetical protein